MYTCVSLPCRTEVNVYPFKSLLYCAACAFCGEKNVWKCHRRGRAGVLGSQMKFFILHKSKFAQKQYHGAIGFNMIYYFAHLN